MEPTGRPRLRTLLLSVGLLALVGAAGVAGYRHFARPGGPGPAAVPPVAGVPEALDFEPRIEEGALSLRAARNAEAVLSAYNIRLSPAQRAYLDANKFLLVPIEGTSLAGTENLDEMLAAFDHVGGDPSDLERVPENAKLVTPDVALHAFHKFFAMTLEEVEEDDLSRHLGEFLSGLLAAAVDARGKAPPAAAAGYEQIGAQAAVALTLLRNQSPPPPDYQEFPESQDVYLAADRHADSLDNALRLLRSLAPGLGADAGARAAAELRLICAAKTMEKSPLFGDYDPDIVADYTQFIPRSHYTKTSGLRAYFRAMMFLGRNGYALKTDAGLRDAVLLAGLFSRPGSGGVPLADRWKRIMDVTALYAGASDDLTYTEWRAFLSEAAGTDRAPPAEAASPATLAKLRAGASKLRLPRIVSDPAAGREAAARPLDEKLFASLSFRIFGQRFTYDGWILNQLTNEARYPASALYVPACFGDRRARSHAESLLARDTHDGSRSIAPLDSLAASIAKVPAADWQASMGAAWLDLLSTLTRSYGPGFPLYMRSEPFGDKQLQTFLGSFTELKHDTLLYAKQSYAEAGEGAEGEVPPVVKGFVEPNLRFWRKLSALVDRTRRFFEERGLFGETVVVYRLREFGEIVALYGSLAEKELRGVPLSEEEYERLRTWDLSFMAEPLDGDEPQIDEHTGKTALVADVHTDARTGVLHEATARPLLMLALVGNEGSPRLTVGVAFDHYEFSEARRLTDEEWKERVHANPPRLPPKPFWYRSLAAK